MRECLWVEELLLWFDANRRKFYWRENNLNSFQWLILEILLRRSKAMKVSSICDSFFAKYKTPDNILDISVEELTNDLSSIGYQKKRAIILKDVSNVILGRFNGKVPEKLDELCSIKHIGIYIASAFLCFKLNMFVTCVDTNVIRIISRIYGINSYGDNRVDTIIGSILSNISSKEINRELNYAILDLGGTTCFSKNPKCDKCPINANCYYFLVNYDK